MVRIRIGKLDLNPHQAEKWIRIRIKRKNGSGPRTRIKVKSRIQIRIKAVLWIRDNL
jgi:hypothetical protein